MTPVADADISDSLESDSCLISSMSVDNFLNLPNGGSDCFKVTSLGPNLLIISMLGSSEEAMIEDCHFHNC